METMIGIELKKLDPPITYRDKILLIGSCFTEHIGNALEELKFAVLQNPNGILFGPDSVCNGLRSYVENRKFKEQDLFQYNELWQSWQHHSRFSGIDAGKTVKAINDSQDAAHAFLKKADWLIITLGSSFTYRLTHEASLGMMQPGEGVANCHRAPANWFRKELMEIDEIKDLLQSTIQRVKDFNPELKFLFTVSPVRHIRDGVVENNRSKARLIETVHYICNKFESAYYFPAYELVVDVLRDYRYYDIDLVHPNYAATQFVLEKFTESCMDTATRELMTEVKSIVIARKHRAFQPETNLHRHFLASHFKKTMELLERHPFLDLKKELVYFSQT